MLMMRIERSEESTSYIASTIEENDTISVIKLRHR